jgi:hypothetical protein
MTRYNAIQLIEGIIYDLSKGLREYTNRPNPKKEIVKANRDRIALLWDIKENLKTLLLYDIWLTVEDKIFLMEKLDPNLTTFIIKIRRKRGSIDNQGFINLDNPNL